MSLATDHGEPSFDIGIDLYRRMADDYRRTCAKNTSLNRTQIAVKIVARTINIPIATLQAKSRKHDIVETRLRLMAFTRIVSLDDRRPNPWKQIGRAFKRHHSTVISSVAKYGEEITHALETPR